MMKKCLSLLLVLAMLLSVVPMGIFADEETVTPGEDDKGQTGTSSVSITATERGASASSADAGLVLVAVYDREGTRLLASDAGEGSANAEVADDVKSDGVCTAKAFLVEAETLIPLAVSETVTVGALEVVNPPEPSEPDPAEKYFHVEKKAGAVWVNGWKCKLDEETVQWPDEVDFKETKVVIDPNAKFESVEKGVFGAFTEMSTLDIGGVVTIGENAFEANTKLTQVNLKVGSSPENTLKEICSGAFLGNPDANQVEFNFDGTREQWEAITVASDAFPENAMIILKGGDKIPAYAGSTANDPDGEDSEQEKLEVSEEEKLDISEPEVQESEAQEPEIQEPEQVETPKEEITVEKAAEDGYYVAPEGSQLVEEASLTGTAAFSGKTVDLGEQVRTSTFTGLMPGEPYLLVVSKSTGSPDSLSEVVAPENLVFADAKDALSDGTLSFKYYQMTTGEAVIVQLYGLPNVRSITLKGVDEDSGEVDENGNPIKNLTLKQGETFQLGVTVVPEQWTEDVQWDVTPAGYVTVANGLITAENAGTAYVTATVTHGVYSFSASCRVQVVNDQAQMLSDVTILTPSVVTELYRTEGTLISIAPEYTDRPNADVDGIATYSADENGTEEALPAAGRMIREAKFGFESTSDEKRNEKEQANVDELNEMFDLEVVDDWTLRLVPTAYAVDHPNEVKNRYTGKILLTVDDTYAEEGKREFVTSEILTVGVKKSTPRLTASGVVINSFYDEKSYKLDIKGATVKDNGISEAEGKSWPDWLNLSGDELTPSLDAGDRRGRAATIYLNVETEEWAIPATVSVGVKLSYQAPALRLSARAVTLSSMNSTGTSVFLQSQDRAKKLENMFIDYVELDSDQLVIGSYNEKTGEVKIVPDQYLTNGTANVVVHFVDTQNVVTLPLQIRTVAPVLHLSKTTVIMNTKYGDIAKVKLYMTPADAQLPDEEDVWVMDSREKNDLSSDLEAKLVEEADGTYLVVRTEATTNPNRYENAYRVHVKMESQKDTVLSVKILKPTTNASLAMRLSGVLDLTYPKNGITLTRTYRNITAPETEKFSLKINGKDAEFDDYLYEGSDGKFYLKDTSEDALVTDLKAGDRLNINCAGMIGEETACSANGNITVRRTLVNMRLSKTNVTLNKDLGETAKITYSYIPNGNDVKRDETPDYIVTDNRGNALQGNPLDVTVNKDNKTVTVKTTDDSVYGGIYKIQLRATKADRYVTLTVKIATKNNSKVTYTAAVSGALDPTRDSSKVTLRYAVRNYVDTNPIVKIVDATTGADYTDLFDLEVNPKNASQIFITKKPKEVLDPSIKYQVIVDCGKREELGEEAVVISGKTTLKVSAGRSSVAADRVVTIYKADPNATYHFIVTSRDRSLNNVEKLTIKDSKLSSVYRIIPLGEGNFEICVVGTNMDKVRSGNLTLNYFVRGMEIQKDGKGNEIPNGAFNLRIVIK